LAEQTIGPVREKKTPFVGKISWCNGCRFFFLAYVFRKSVLFWTDGQFSFLLMVVFFFFRAIFYTFSWPWYGDHIALSHHSQVMIILTVIACIVFV